jgi:aspartate aminotransferase
VVIVNSPCNPTGAVYTEAAVTELGAIAEAYDATIISDEIYERIVYDVEPTTTAALDGLGERTVTVNGFSKAYSMTGWRLGYLAGPADVVAGVGKVHSHSVSCAANFVQHAGVEALEGPEEPVEAMVDAFRSRRDLLVDLLEEADVDVTVPDGAF